MPVDRAEEALARFAATLPRYLRLYLEGTGDCTQQDWEAYRGGDPKKDQVLIREYERLLDACPKKRRAYIRRKLATLKTMLPSVKPGRPRKDSDVEESTQLKSSGKSWPQIGRVQGKSGDAVRKLAKSREKQVGK